VLGIGAGGIGRRIGDRIRRLDDIVGQHPGFDLIAADIGQHVTVDFHAGGKGLAALLFHLPAEGGILDDVLFFKGKTVLAEDGADAFAPAAVGFQIGSNFGCFHDALRGGWFGE
jgi:hypothetical protein